MIALLRKDLYVADKQKRLVVVLALVCSSLFAWVPGLNRISAGLAIVICTVAAAAICAVVFPVAEREEAPV